VDDSPALPCVGRDKSGPYAPPCGEGSCLAGGCPAWDAIMQINDYMRTAEYAGRADNGHSQHNWGVENQGGPTGYCEIRRGPIKRR